jgi:hypothetical protein
LQGLHSITQKMAVKSLQNFDRKKNFLLFKPLLSVGVFYFSMALFLLSCSSFSLPFGDNKKSDLIGTYLEMSSSDYEDHLYSLKSAYLKGQGVRVITIQGSAQKYITSILNEIIAKNEIFFKKLRVARVTILASDAPLHFSLPKGEIFLSKGLVSKYIKNESMLACILAYELIRSERVLYPRQTIVPIGHFSTERMVSLNRLTLDEKMEIHKWAYHLTVRSGFDGEYYLSWLQIQNRNTADFLFQVGDVNQINREESLFKAFLIKQPGEEQIISKQTSSKNFYTFINVIRDYQ